MHVRSLTKPAAPGLRISALIARGPALARLRAARIVEDLYVPGPLQEAALELVGTPAWRAHLRRLRRTLRERRDALAGALGELRPRRLPEGGMNLWVRCRRAPTTASSPSARSPPACRLARAAVLRRRAARARSCG